VQAARQRQLERFAGTNIICNADMRVAEVRKFCKLDETGDNLIRSAIGQIEPIRAGLSPHPETGVRNCELGRQRSDPGTAPGRGAAIQAQRDEFLVRKSRMVLVGLWVSLALGAITAITKKLCTFSVFCYQLYKFVGAANSKK
jgi:hypothetical protein